MRRLLAATLLPLLLQGLAAAEPGGDAKGYADAFPRSKPLTEKEKAEEAKMVQESKDGVDELGIVKDGEVPPVNEACGIVEFDNYHPKVPLKFFKSTGGVYYTAIEKGVGKDKGKDKSFTRGPSMDWYLKGSRELHFTDIRRHVVLPREGAQIILKQLRKLMDCAGGEHNIDDKILQKIEDDEKREAQRLADLENQTYELAGWPPTDGSGYEWFSHEGWVDAKIEEKLPDPPGGWKVLVPKYQSWITAWDADLRRRCPPDDFPIPKSDNLGGLGHCENLKGKRKKKEQKKKRQQERKEAKSRLKKKTAKTSDGASKQDEL